MKRHLKFLGHLQKKEALENCLKLIEETMDNNLLGMTKWMAEPGLAEIAKKDKIYYKLRRKGNSGKL